jgi:hypothetical protein
VVLPTTKTRATVKTLLATSLPAGSRRQAFTNAVGRDVTSYVSTSVAPAFAGASAPAAAVM